MAIKGGNRAENEGLRLLDDFVCQADPAPGALQTECPASGKNEGIRVVEELVSGCQDRELARQQHAMPPSLVLGMDD